MRVGTHGQGMYGESDHLHAEKTKFYRYVCIYSQTALYLP